VTLLEYTDSFKLVKQASPSYFLTQKESLINIESFKNVEGMGLIEKMELYSIPLSSMADVKAGLMAYEIGKGNPPQTKEMKGDRVYHTHTRMDDSYLKYLDGKDVCRYYLTWSGEFLKYDNLAAPRTDFRLFAISQDPGNWSMLQRYHQSLLSYCQQLSDQGHFNTALTLLADVETFLRTQAIHLQTADLTHLEQALMDLAKLRQTITNT
jgi:hypothetical protein